MRFSFDRGRIYGLHGLGNKAGQKFHCGGISIGHLFNLIDDLPIEQGLIRPDCDFVGGGNQVNQFRMKHFRDLPEQVQGRPLAAGLDIDHRGPADSEVLSQQILAHTVDFSRLTDFPSQYTINLVEVRHETESTVWGGQRSTPANMFATETCLYGYQLTENLN